MSEPSVRDIMRQIMGEPRKIKVPVFMGPLHGESLQFPVGHMEEMHARRGSWIMLEDKEPTFNILETREEILDHIAEERKRMHNYKPIKIVDLQGGEYWILQHEDCQCMDLSNG